MKRAIIISIFLITSCSIHAQLHDERGIWNKELHIVTGQNVNIRSKAGAESKVIDQLNIGHTIQIEKVEGSFTLNKLVRPFYKILYSKGNGVKTGYIWSGYVSQYYKREINQLIFLKEEKGSNGGISRVVSVNMFEDNNSIKVGEIDMHEVRSIYITKEKLIKLDGLKNMIQIKVIHGGAICEGQHTYYTFLESTDNQWIPLKQVDSYTAEDGNSIKKLIFPHEIGGEDGKIILASIKYGIHEIKYELRKEKYYKWNGIQIIEYAI